MLLKVIYLTDDEKLAGKIEEANIECYKNSKNYKIQQTRKTEENGDIIIECVVYEVANLN